MNNPKRTQPVISRYLLAMALPILLAGAAYGQKNVLQPSDAIIASSANAPGSEGVKNAIDGTQAKYLNFDSKQPGGSPSGFVVTPAVGQTWVTGIAMQSANDAPARDPKSITIEGSNDDSVTNFTDGNWELVYANTNIPAWTVVFPGGNNVDRYQWQTLKFDNFKPYKHYRWTVLVVQEDNTCCMQIAEVQLLGTTVPKNILQPSDGIIASSANAPGSEGVKNAIDGTQAKYLNFDSKQPGGSPSGFVVTPGVGATLLNGISMQSANDAPARDPKSITLEGSNDDTVTNFTDGTWETVYVNTNIPAWTTVWPGGNNVDRYQTQTFLFDNVQPYKHYRWTVLVVQEDNTCCMQIAEVQLLGSGAPKNVLQPSDPIIASSANAPGSEGVKNAIDGTQAKYLNFDSKQPGGSPSGFVVTPAVGATAVTGVSMQSANDAPARDPKSITIEGSNDDSVTNFTDGTWELVYANTNIPAWTVVFPGGNNVDRYQTQTFYFPNKTEYKHYRWTVLVVQEDNTCCMQIAEVGLLAATAANDCSKAAFVLQPENTPVLSGAQATFFTAVNGPWTLQWMTNGVAIPGASAGSFTTEAVTAANKDILYSVAIVGCSTSAPVKANLFTPSTTKSIGMQFAGGGANGAPVYTTTNDITGVQLQAYFNAVTNLNANSGSTGDGLSQDLFLLNSDGAESTITFEYTSSGRWGSGVGTDSATQRLLNGTAGPGDFIFHNVPAGKHSLLVYAVSPPLQFNTAMYSIVTNGFPNEMTNYMAIMNSDQYKPAPGFYRSASISANGAALGNFVRFDNIQVAEGNDLALHVEVTGGGQNTGVSALQLLLNAPAVGSPPVITQQPEPTVGPSNGVVTLTVQATGNDLSYQWRKNGYNLQDGGGISGSETATLTISALSFDDQAVYSVAIFSPAGSTVSANAVVTVSKYSITDSLAGYWKLDPTSGASAPNSLSGGLPIVVDTSAGPPTWTAGKVANCLSFDGSTTFGVVSNYPKATRAISGSAWVNIDPSAATPMTIARNGLADLRAPGDNSPVPSGNFDFRVTQDANDQSLHLNIRIQAGPNFPEVTAPAAFPLGAWTYVAFTADGAQLRLYINGQQVGSADYLDDLKTSTVDIMSVGVRMNTNDVPEITLDATPNYLFGKLDELAVWNRALPADEITQVYQAGLAGKPMDSVVLTPPLTTPPTLTLTNTGGVWQITYEGTLQSSDTADGDYADVSGATSPYTVNTSTGNKFFRARR
jgi:hypothetical protein